MNETGGRGNDRDEMERLFNLWLAREALRAHEQDILREGDRMEVELFCRQVQREAAEWLQRQIEGGRFCA